MNNNTKNYYRIEPENYREGKSDIIIQPKMQPEMTLVFLHGMGDSPLGMLIFLSVNIVLFRLIVKLYYCVRQKLKFHVLIGISVEIGLMLSIEI